MLEIFLLWFSFLTLTAAQTAETAAQAVNAENINRLSPQTFIEFAPLEADIGAVSSGWHTISADGAYLALRNRAGDVVILSSDGASVARYAVPGQDGGPAQVLDMRFDPRGSRLASLHSDGTAVYRTAVYDLEANTLLTFELETGGGRPISLWFDSSEDRVWVEVLAAQMVEGDQLIGIDLTTGATRIQPSPLADERDAQIRLGHIVPPFAVTISDEGSYRRYHLIEADEPLEVQAEAVADIGALDPSGRYLAWREALSGDLHLLDFQRREDREVGQPGEGYIQALFVGGEGDVILAVDIAFEPIVSAWQVESGERVDLGSYRSCGRSPDAVRMSHDGSTLSIGCRDGIQIWRVGEDAP